jgi:hypothetical protein
MRAGRPKIIFASNNEDYPEDWKARRCIAIKHATGQRCRNYAAPGDTRCWKHGAGGKAYRMRYQFKTKTLQDAYEVLASNPDRLDLGEELGLARLILQTLVSRTEKLGSENGEAILSLTRNIGDLAGTMSRIEKDIRQTVNAEQLRTIADQMLLIVTRHIKDPEVLGKIQDDLCSIALPINENDPC